MSPDDKSDILTKKIECVLHRQMEHKFVVVILHIIYLMLI